MGEVYRARDHRLDRDVAVKVLPGALATDPGALARFEREAKAVAALSHPNILAIFDFGTSGAVAYAAMELLDGQTLRDRLANGALPLRKAIDIALQIAHGLAAAHEKGIIHRDLKPENVFVTADGRVKILDFGLAKAVPAQAAVGATVAATSDQTTPGTVMGTVGYMSPEQITGAPVDHRTDIFAFGAIVYEMLAGRRAFKRDSTAETIAAILKEDPPELSSIGTLPHREGLVDRHSSPREARGAVLAVHELHRQRMGGAALRAAFGHSVDLGHVRMVERGQRLRLALEPREPLGVPGEELRQDLQRHRAIKTRVACLVDLARAACPEQRLDCVGSESGSCGEAHTHSHDVERPAPRAGWIS